jgi:hypothetical protein
MFLALAGALFNLNVYCGMFALCSGKDIQLMCHCLHLLFIHEALKAVKSYIFQTHFSVRFFLLLTCSLLKVEA